MHVKTGFLPNHLGTNIYHYGDMKIGASTLERAILECLYLSPKQTAGVMVKSPVKNQVFNINLVDIPGVIAYYSLNFIMLLYC